SRDVVAGNVCVGGFWDVNKEGQWQGGTIEAAARPYLKMEQNFVAEDGKDPGFVDAANGDYRLKADSALVKDGYSSIPGPEEFGLQTPRMKAKAAAARERASRK
ncbi:MAG: hypothetical protein HUK22_06265, partial [Thermoguttaceae bacterium]|nr:hypothetical protein [Thermoguttaceae bacterium]